MFRQDLDLSHQYLGSGSGSELFQFESATKLSNDDFPNIPTAVGQESRTELLFRIRKNIQDRGVRNTAGDRMQKLFFQLFLLPQELDLPSPGGIHYGFKTDVITFYNSPCGRAHLSRLVPPPNVRFSPPQTWSNRSEQDRPKHSISSPANGNIQIKHYAALTVLWSRSRRRSRKKTGGFGSSSIDLIICSVV